MTDSWSPSESVAITLTAELASVPRARRVAVDALTAWGLEGLVADAQLVMSELVTNAVLHARAPIEVAIRRRGDAVRIEVGDHSPVLPVTRKHRLDAGTGRGLVLVAGLSRRWAVDASTDGKVVWAEIVRRTPTEPAAEIDASASGQPVDLDALAALGGWDTDDDDSEGESTAAGDRPRSLHGERTKQRTR